MKLLIPLLSLLSLTASLPVHSQMVSNDKPELPQSTFVDDAIRTMTVRSPGVPLPNERSVAFNNVSTPLSVVSVADGDTMTVSSPNGAKTVLRFAYVDAPEVPHTKADDRRRDRNALNQYRWGAQSKARLQQWLIQNGNRVQVKDVGADPYGRRISEIYPARGGEMVQLTLLREGLAVPYFVPKSGIGTVVMDAGNLAKQRHVGVYSDPNFQLPSQFRK